MSKVSFTPLEPWTPEARQAVLDVVEDMAELDREEIFGLRPTWHTAQNVVNDVALLIGARRVIEGFIAWRPPTRGGAAVPVAVALAFRSTMPKVADVALFGRQGHGRAVPAVYLELASRMVSFGHRHHVAIVQVPILTNHHAARRMARALGGEPVFDYGPIGTHGQSYTHTIWRL
jgi:hypothetical protein